MSKRARGGLTNE
jgi:hypothetical protein